MPNVKTYPYKKVMYDALELGLFTPNQIERLLDYYSMNITEFLAKYYPGKNVEYKKNFDVSKKESLRKLAKIFKYLNLKYNCDAADHYFLDKKVVVLAQLQKTTKNFTFRDFAEHTETEILRTPGLGRKAISYFRWLLFDLNLLERPIFQHWNWSYASEVGLVYMNPTQYVKHPGCAKLYLMTLKELYPTWFKSLSDSKKNYLMGNYDIKF